MLLFRLPTHSKTWMRPRFEYWHLIDCVISKTTCGADCWIDNQPILLKHKICILHMRRSQDQKTSKRLNVSKLKSRKAAGNVSSDLQSKLTDMVYDAGANIEEPWQPSEMSSTLLPLNTLHQLHNTTKSTGCRKNNFFLERIRMIHPQNLVRAKLIAQTKLREMKDKWLRDKAKRNSRAPLAARSPSAFMIHCRLCTDLSIL